MDKENDVNIWILNDYEIKFWVYSYEQKQKI